MILKTITFHLIFKAFFTFLFLDNKTLSQYRPPLGLSVDWDREIKTVFLFFPGRENQNLTYKWNDIYPIVSSAHALQCNVGQDLKIFLASEFSDQWKTEIAGKIPIALQFHSVLKSIIVVHFIRSFYLIFIHPSS